MKKSYLCLVSYSFSLIALSEVINQRLLLALICYIIAFALLYPVKRKCNKKTLLAYLTITIISCLISLSLKLEVNLLAIIVHVFYNFILLSVINSLKRDSYFYCLKMISISLIVLFSLLLVTSLASYIITQTSSSSLSYTFICIFIFTPFLLSYLSKKKNIYQKALN